MSKILIIEDNNEINGLLSELISNIGHQVVSAYSGPEGLRLFREDSFSLILLDLMLPGKSGEEILVEMRSNSNIPIIVISAKSDIDEKVKLLESGANDYITKPFEPKELLFRVAVVLRRFERTIQDTLQFSNITINRKNYEMKINDETIILPLKEFEILSLLIARANQITPRQLLMEHVWGYENEGNELSLNTHINRIRERLKRFDAKIEIQTMRGIGYKLEEII